VIYSTRSSIADLPASPPADWMARHCNHVVPEVGPLTTVHLVDVGFKFCLPNVEGKAGPTDFSAEPRMGFCIDLSQPISAITSKDKFEKANPFGSGPAKIKPPK
jgi:hypothetical protein